MFLAGGIIGKASPCTSPSATSNRPRTANQNGLGIDIWFVPFNQITNFLQIFFVFEVLYTLTLGIIKISICFLFLRLFPERRIRRYLWATQVFNVTVVVVYVIVDLAQCQPMSYFWDMWEYVDLFKSEARDDRPRILPRKTQFSAEIIPSLLTMCIGQWGTCRSLYQHLRNGLVARYHQHSP